MGFGPDILVVSPDDLTTHMLVEVGESISAADRERSLKHQMIRTGVPTGLLVTPTWLTIYRDTFTDYLDSSIQAVEQIPTSDIESLQPFAAGLRSSGADFEDAVQEWLAQLKYRLDEGFLRGSDLKPAVREHILPALRSGEIRASGPRYPRRAVR